MALRVCFFHSDKPRECILADAWAKGASLAGDAVELRRLTPEIQLAEADVAVMVGVKSRELYRAHWDAGQHVIMVDKGYTRHAAPGPVKLWEYWRVAVDGHHPTRTLMDRPRPDDRWRALDLSFAPWRTSGRHIILAGSSAKYHDFYGLWDPTRWARKLVRELKKVTDREIIYRPKPSWRDAEPIEGTTWGNNGSQIEDALKGAHALITHGSNAVFEAVQLGVPCVVLGDAVAKPISSTDISEIEWPRLASDAERRQWFANLAYCQWTLPEIAAGKMWEIVRPQIYG